jgi:hypothetical protein
MSEKNPPNYVHRFRIVNVDLLCHLYHKYFIVNDQIKEQMQKQWGTRPTHLVT